MQRRLLTCFRYLYDYVFSIVCDICSLKAYNVLFVSCFLLLSFCLFVHNFIDNYVSCHVCLVPFGVRQLLSRATENSAQGDKQARGKSKKQKAKSTL